MNLKRKIKNESEMQFIPPYLKHNMNMTHTPFQAFDMRKTNFKKGDQN